ncbi:unnamed protein product [Effrenium voratum]|nr:unnamed protein product [Effrenium voratum]
MIPWLAGSRHTLPCQVAAPCRDPHLGVAVPAAEQPKGPGSPGQLPCPTRGGHLAVQSLGGWRKDQDLSAEDHVAVALPVGVPTLLVYILVCKSCKCDAQQSTKADAERQLPPQVEALIRPGMLGPSRVGKDVPSPSEFAHPDIIGPTLLSQRVAASGSAERPGAMILKRWHQELKKPCEVLAELNGREAIAAPSAGKDMEDLQRVADRDAATAALRAAVQAAEPKALQAAIEKAEARGPPDQELKKLLELLAEMNRREAANVALASAAIGKAMEALKAAIAAAKEKKVKAAFVAEAEKKLQELQRLADHDAAMALRAAAQAADPQALQAAIEKAEARGLPDQVLKKPRQELAELKIRQEARAALAKATAGKNMEDDFELMEVLGKGAFGTVFALQKGFAVKITAVPNQEEAALWKACSSSPFVVRLHHVWHDEISLMVCERCQESLMPALERGSGDWRRIFRQMLLGVAHTHGVGIVHRDIKPENFLWGGPDHQTLKLCDYGLAVEMPAGALLREVRGTPPYMAPELEGGYDFAVDMWGIGVIAHMVHFGKYPYQGVDAAAVRRAVVEDVPPLELSFEGEAGIAFTRALLRRAPSERPAAREALQHAFVAEHHEACCQMAPRASTMPVRIKRVFAWYIFACLAIAVATILAAVRLAGEKGQLMDAGHVYFKDGTG